MIKEIDTGKIVYSCKDPDVCVSAAQASRESDAAGAVIYQTPAAAMEVVGQQVEIVTSNPKMSIGKRGAA